jgi:uncharacterized protein (TIGR04255 family)
VSRHGLLCGDRIQRGLKFPAVKAEGCIIVCSVAPSRARKHPKLESAPLASVICQARYSHVLALQTEDGQRELLAELQAGLPEYPLFTRVAQQALTLSPEGIEPSAEKVSSFQFMTGDEQWIVGIGVDSVSLQTRNYEHFRDLQDRWRHLADVVHDVLRPALQTRFGLRYVDELTSDGADTPQDWSGLLRKEFYGLGSSPKWNDRVRQSYQEWVIALDSGLCTVRHGFLPPLFQNRSPYYLLDVDCYVEDPQGFDPAKQESLLDAFNDAAHELFVWSISKELYESFGPERTK